MEKIKEFIKKHDTIVMLIVLGMISLTFAFVLKLDAGDTLWNFSNVYKMSNGYQIYNDLNVIITPLYFYIGKIIFQIFPRNYLTYNIYQNLIIYVLLFGTCYSLMKKIKIRKLDAMLFTTIISLITIAVMPEGSYNMLAILFAIIGVYNIIANIDSNKNRHIVNIIQGIICFLVFATKQNTGALFVIGMSLAQIITTKGKKNAIINLVEQGITAIFLTTGLLFYMYQNNYLDGFINFCFSRNRRIFKSKFKI
ncbi:MAG: hypothetical protein J6M60_06765 [Clostridia bacterium]|nr:hypothetical protein [Clostridia bacterium]